MAKNNNTAPKSTNVPASSEVKTAPLATLANLAALKAKRAALKAEMDKLAEEESTAQSEVKTQFWGQIAELPAAFGLTSVVEVRSLLSEYIRAQESGNPMAGSRKPLTREERATIETLLRAKTPMSEIMAKTNRSLPTIQNIKKDIGLVKERGATTLSGPAAKFELPAGAALPITPEV